MLLADFDAAVSRRPQSELSTLFSSGVHLNKIGYMRLADVVCSAIQGMPAAPVSSGLGVAPPCPPSLPPPNGPTAMARVRAQSFSSPAMGKSPPIGRFTLGVPPATGQSSAIVQAVSQLPRPVGFAAMPGQ